PGRRRGPRRRAGREARGGVRSLCLKFKRAAVRLPFFVSGCCPSPLVGEGGAKRRTRGLYPQPQLQESARRENPSPLSPLRGEPPSPLTRGEGKKRLRLEIR